MAFLSSLVLFVLTYVHTYTNAKAQYNFPIHEIIKNPDGITGPLARPFASLLLLYASLSSLVRSLAHSLNPTLVGKWGIVVLSHPIVMHGLFHVHNARHFGFPPFVWFPRRFWLSTLRVAPPASSSTPAMASHIQFRSTR